MSLVTLPSSLSPLGLWLNDFLLFYFFKIEIALVYIEKKKEKKKKLTIYLKILTFWLDALVLSSLCLLFGTTNSVASLAFERQWSRNESSCLFHCTSSATHSWLSRWEILYSLLFYILGERSKQNLHNEKFNFLLKYLIESHTECLNVSLLLFLLFSLSLLAFL